MGFVSKDFKKMPINTFLVIGRHPKMALKRGLDQIFEKFFLLDICTGDI